MKHTLFIVILECFPGFTNLNDGCGITIGGTEAKNGGSGADVLEKLTREITFIPFDVGNNE